MKITTIQELAVIQPNAKVRLFFRHMQGVEGILDTTASHAAMPNRSQWFFPPENLTAADIGWPVPCWHATECYRVLVLG